MKQVLKRVEKAYDVLVELGYVEYYKSYQDKSEDTYYIIYKFNSKKDGECHVSSFIENSKLNKTKEITYSKEKEKYVEKSNFNSDDIEEAEIVEIIDEKPKKEEKLKIESKKEIKKEVVKKSEKNNEFIYPDEVIKYIQKAKKNIYVSRSWDKRTDTKIKKIFIEEGEIILIEVLKIIYKNLNSNIKNSKFVGELQKEKTATVIYADENGYFSFVPVHKGYWGFAALGAGGEMKHNGKELSQDAVLWIEAK